MKKGKKFQSLRDEVLNWFAENQRELPWRAAYDPYHVWISEIMLQQTQMERGVEYFNRWLEIFPDIHILADATEQKVLKAWEGLGYYSRARNLLKAAELMVGQHGGQVPDDYEQLLGLPGIGPYTAGAIMSIAFNQPYPVIDANVERLFSRVKDIEKPMKERAVFQDLYDMLTEMLRDVSPREYNQGLMELGALVCTPANPDCRVCPLQQHCRAYTVGTVLERPIKPKKQEKIDIVMACSIIENKGKYFIQQRLNDDVWGGLWEFPGGRLKNGETAAQAAERELLEETEIKIEELVPFKTVTHYYTRYRVTLHSFLWKTDDKLQPKIHAAQQYRWVSLEELSEYAFPSGHRQLIEMLEKRGR